VKQLFPQSWVHHVMWGHSIGGYLAICLITSFDRFDRAALFLLPPPSPLRNFCIFAAESCPGCGEVVRLQGLLLVLDSSKALWCASGNV